MRITYLSLLALVVVSIVTDAHSQSTYFDDSGPNFSTTGSWTVNPNKPGAYLDSHTWSHFLHPSGGGSVPGLATWNVTSASGEYDVSVRWHLLSNRATDAKYDVTYDGGQSTGNIVIDQTDGTQLDAEGFTSLGVFCDPTQVNLSNIATQTDTPFFTGYVSADAVRLVRTGDCGPESSGKAYIPYWRSALVGTVNVDASVVVRNVSSEQISVTVDLRQDDGTQFTDDGSDTTGNITVLSLTPNAINYDDSGPVTFDLASQAMVVVFVSLSSGDQIGGGSIEWSSGAPIAGGKALTAHVRVNASRTNLGIEAQGVSVNGGNPF